LQKSPVCQRFIDIVTALANYLIPVEIRNLGGEAFIKVVVIERMDLIDFHRVDYAIAFGLRAQTDNPIAHFGRSANCGFSVGKCAATPKWVR